MFRYYDEMELLKPAEIAAALNGQVHALRRRIPNYNSEAFSKLPHGYETEIGTNSKIQLSGARIARIDLARTLMRPVPIYILDEFSASLDDETEMAILNNLSKVEAVIICVTHKMRTMDFCNKGWM